MEGFQEKFPKCYTVLNTLKGKISESEMQELNLMVSEGELSPKEAAMKYLKEAGLI